MPEPDFDELARRISGWFRDDHREIIDPIEALRQVWNARGAADVEAIRAYNSDDELNRIVMSLDR